MSDEKRAILGETLRDEFQALLKSLTTGFLVINPLSPEDCREFHILEAEMNRFAETIHEWTALATRLSAGFSAAAPPGCRSKETGSDKESTPTSCSGHLNPGSEDEYPPASRSGPETSFDAQSVSPSSEPVSGRPGIGLDARFAGSPSEKSRPKSAAPVNGNRFRNRGTSTGISNARPHKEASIPGDKPDRNFQRFPGTIDPVGTGVGSKTPRHPPLAQIPGSFATCTDHIPPSASIAKTGMASEGTGSSLGRQTMRAFTGNRKGRAAPFSSADEAAMPQEDRDGEFLSIEAAQAMPAAVGPPVAPEERPVKGLVDLARFVESSHHGGTWMRSERSASHQSQRPASKRTDWVSGIMPETQKAIGTSNFAAVTGHNAPALETTHQGTGDGFDDPQYNKAAPFPPKTVSIRRHPSRRHDAQIGSPGIPVFEDSRNRNVSRAHGEAYKIRTDIASDPQAPFATSVKKVTGAAGPFMQDGRPWLEKPGGIEDKDLDNLMEALAREIHREYQRFYGD